MKNRFFRILALLTAVICLASMPAEVLAVSYDKVATASDKAESQEVGAAGLTPVSADEVKAGTYDNVKVESSSSMFRIEKATLNVADGKMTADITLSGNGYLCLYMGTGDQAAAASESDYISYKEGSDGSYTYTIAVPALDEPFDCAAFSKKKEMWYDRQLLVRADSLPEAAVLTEVQDYDALMKQARNDRIDAMKSGSSSAESENSSGSTNEPADIDLKNGEYPIDVSFGGGSGKATVTSPATLIVRDKKAYARIGWSSSHYDYMLVGGQKYEPVNKDGNSQFEIPVTVFDEPMNVVADTTAMSEPHEINYTLTFDSESIQKDTGISSTGTAVIIVLIICAGVAAAFVIYKKRSRKS